MSDKSNKLSVEDLILYILNKLEPEKSDKIRLNKLAFFVEFAYLLRYGNDLSNARYAAIDKGPVIDKYDIILKEMKSAGSVKMDGYIVRPLKSSSAEIPTEVCTFIDDIIAKYSKLNNSELVGLSHLTDSYKITTDNEKTMGKIIDKKLAMLETFLTAGEECNQLSEGELPKVDRSKLVRYAG